MRFPFKLLSAAALLCLIPSAFAASTLSGIVTNKTTNKPSGGDDVTLIKLAQGMQESTKTKTDAKGRFKLDIPDDGIHLVRVTHDKANYFRPIQPGTESVEVEVYNASAKVDGIASGGNVMRIQSEPSGNTLHVVQNFFVENTSTPPTTQFSDRPFEFYLPQGAIVVGSAALGPGGMPVQSAPVPLGDTPNHYTFLFPIRPGETRFQITYNVPYTGSLQFDPHPTLPTDTVAIIMPRSMTFKAGTSSPYSAVTEEATAQTYVARNVQPSQPLQFTVSGTGQLPRDSAQGATSGAPGQQDTPQQGVQGQAATGTDTKPGGGLGNPIDPEGANDPWAKYKWWIIGGLGLLLAAGAGFLFTTGKPTAAATTIPTAAAAPGGVLGALKEEFFTLESDRLTGKITEAEYTEHRAALDVVLKRAITRANPGNETPQA